MTMAAEGLPKEDQGCRKPCPLRNFSRGLWLAGLWLRLKPGLQLASGLGLVLGLGG